jgi:predicted transcriptional regulator
MQNALFATRLVIKGFPAAIDSIGTNVMNLIILVVILLILFGGGGFYYGGPYVGGGLGTILLTILIVLLLRGWRGHPLGNRPSFTDDPVQATAQNLEEPMAEHPELLGLATEIVSARVSNNAIAADQLPGLIQQVFNALATVEQATAAPAKPEPATEVRRSVVADHIVCLDCGKHFSMLRRHLMTDHKMTPEQYRQRWELPASCPLVAPDYAKARSSLVKKTGLGRRGLGGTKEGTENEPETRQSVARVNRLTAIR